MGRHMIPVCCICGVSAGGWHDPAWEDAGGLQDFCPGHAADARGTFGPFVECCGEEMKQEETFYQ